RQMFTVEPMLLGIVVFTTVAIGIGTVTAMVLVYRERAARADVDVVRASSRQHELEKQVLEARLKLLQAQIEPHFLFNTLANVQHLTDVNPPLASKTLESLITYLRAALPQMREDSTKLGREVAMAVAFLDIQSVRMGTRLQFSVDIPDALAGESIPPMMLLTLIENAIKHGIDPLPQGGAINLAAKREGDTLEVSVSDTGGGLSTAAGIGVGLSNIRERLSTLYGKRANLRLEENSPTGVVATISISQA
ncbi:MAG: histidine kinase, partial [Pseudomonadota bacterium]